MPQAEAQKRRENVIEVLNRARAMELQAIHQYMNQHYNLDDMDYGEMAAKMKLIAIDEMRHAEAFAERIKELGGGSPPAKSPVRWSAGRRSRRSSPSIWTWKTTPS